MSAGYFDKAVRLSFGQVAAGAAIEVRHTGGGLADIYSNAAMTTPLSNPGVLGDDGRYEFYALFGVYNITVGAGASAATYRFKLDGDGVNFLTRADFVSAVADGYAPTGGTVVTIGGLSWMVIPIGHVAYGADPIAVLPGWMPAGVTYPDHFAENTIPGTTDMRTAIQAAMNYEAVKVGASGGYFGIAAPRVDFLNSEYYCGGTVSVGTEAKGMRLIGGGALIVTDYDGPVFSFGDAGVFTADAVGTAAMYGVRVRGFKFKNTNLTAMNSVAVRLGRCWDAYVEYNTFYDFWLDIDGHGCGHSYVNNNFAYSRNRTAEKHALLRLQGVYASDNDLIDSTGIHFYSNEVSGDTSDPTLLYTTVEIKCCDGFYYGGNHTQNVRNYYVLHPTGSADNYKNNRVFDIISHGGNYKDDPGGAQVLITGSVAHTGAGGRQNGLMHNIRMDPSDWIRGAGNATNGVTFSVADGGGFVAQHGGIRGVRLCGTFDQHTGAAIVVAGADSSKIECIGLEVTGTFTRGNVSGAGGTSCGAIEAHSVHIHDITVGPETNPPDYLFNLNMSGASAGDGQAVIINGIDDSQSTWTSRQFNLDSEVGGHVSIKNVSGKAGQGRIIEYEFRADTPAPNGAVYPWSYTIPGLDVGVTVSIDAIGVSDAASGTGDRVSASRYTGTWWKNGAGTVSRIGETVDYLHSNITANDAPVRVILMTGSAWPTTTAVSAGDVYVAGGNVYLVTKAGTTGASAPTHTSGFASTGTETSFYAGAEDVDALQAILSGGTTDLWWTGKINLMQAR